MLQTCLLNYLVPNVISTDVNDVRKVLEICSLKLLKKKPIFHLKSFSATDYLFASTFVAKSYPHLIESKLILMYRSAIPEPIGNTNYFESNHSNNNNHVINIKKKNLWNSLFVTIMTLFLHIGALPSSIQKFIINIISSSFFVSLSFMIMF